MAPEALFDRKYTVKSDVYVDRFNCSQIFLCVQTFTAKLRILFCFMADTDVFLSAGANFGPQDPRK